MQAEPLPQHQWLQKLVGKWSSEMNCSTGPDQPPSIAHGTEVVRKLGELWTIGEGEAQMPDSPPFQSIMTLGYDPLKQKYVGSFVASVMTHLWPYEGTVDDSGKRLALNSRGPGMSGGPELVDYLDVIEFVTDDYRTLTSHLRDEQGEWQPFMTVHYRRQ